MKNHHQKELIKIVLSIIFLILSYWIKEYSSLFLIISYIIVSYSMYLEALENLKKKDFFDENILMILATLGAFYIGSNLEAVLVMILFQIGEFLSHLAVHKSKESITKMMDLRVEEVEIENKGKVRIKEVKENDIYIVKPGEKIPLDGIVVEGESFLDTSSMTGETTPKKVKENDSILSGCINRESLLKVKATSTYQTTSTQKIIDLMEKSNDKKSTTETFIRKFSKKYTPIVVGIALLLVLIPTLFHQDFSTWLYRALVFLVTSCPCALVISVPLGYFCGIGRASREGIVVKGSKELEKCTDIDYVLLDKTGTITEGVFEVTKIECKITKEDFIKVLASVEQNSIHPIAKAIIKINKNDYNPVKNYKEISGKGISCKIDNKLILVGNDKLLEDNNIVYDKADEIGTIIYLVIDKEYQGYIVISDKIKKENKELKTIMKQDIIVLSGDNDDITKDISKKIGIKKSYGNLLPLDKVEKVREYQKQGKVLFVGDGINDAPVIKIADVGISMGKIGSDAALEASDIIFMQEDVRKIKTIMDIAIITKRKVMESIILALTIKFIVLFLAAIGKSTILLAVFADVGVTLIAIINVLTILFKKIERR